MEPASIDATQDLDQEGLASCPRCGYRALRHNILRHLRRANACSPLTEGGPSIGQARSQYGIQPEGQRPARVPCDACGNTFSCNQALQRHVQTNCPGEPAMSVVATAANASPVTAIAAPRRRGPRRTRYADLPLPEGTKRSYASFPDTSHISAEMLDKWLKRPLAGLTNLVDEVWFNPAVPQNMTYDWINTCHNDVLKYNGREWMREDIGDAVESLCWDAYEIMEQYLIDHPSARASLLHEANRTLIRLAADEKEETPEQVKLAELVRKRWREVRNRHCKP